VKDPLNALSAVVTMPLVNERERELYLPQ